MAKTSHRKFIAAVAALSILITGFGAAQAQARDYSTERAIAALLGLAVIGSIIANESKAERKTDPVIHKPKVIEARPLPRDLAPRAHGQRKALPAECLREVRTDRGPVRYFAARCMNRTYDFVNRLPARCERQIRTDRGLRQGWGAKCLRGEGYVLARH
jgi:hypothetical protein